MNKRQEYTDTYIQFMKEAKDNNLITTQLMTKLHYYETALHRLAEIACNRDTTSHEDKRESSIILKVIIIAGLLGFRVRINRDPHWGGAIRFILPSGKSNNWDGEWGIYW